MPKILSATFTNTYMHDRYDKVFRNGQAYYEAGGAADVNTVLEEIVLSSTNTPDNSFWYVRTTFYGNKTTTSNRTQVAYAYNEDKPIMYRYYNNGWSAWKSGDIVSVRFSDYTGYILDSSGNLEQWGNVYITPSAANTVASVVITFPLTYDNVPFITAIPQIGTPNLVTFSVGGGSTTTAAKQSMVVYMTRTAAASTHFRWYAKGYKQPF